MVEVSASEGLQEAWDDVRAAKELVGLLAHRLLAAEARSGRTPATVAAELEEDGMGTGRPETYDRAAAAVRFAAGIELDAVRTMAPPARTQRSAEKRTA